MILISDHFLWFDFGHDFKSIKLSWFWFWFEIISNMILPNTVWCVEIIMVMEIKIDSGWKWLIGTVISSPVWLLYFAGRIQQWETGVFHSFPTEAWQHGIHCVTQCLVLCTVTCSRYSATSTCYYWASTCANPWIYSVYIG